MPTFTHDGKEFDARISNCVLHMGGTFAGNLDFEISFNREIDIDDLKANLRLRDEHGRDSLLQIKGFAGDDDRYDITTTWPMEPAPAHIEFFWRGGDVSLGEIPVKEVRPEDYDDSERFEREHSGGCMKALLFCALGGGAALKICQDLLPAWF